MVWVHEPSKLLMSRPFVSCKYPKPFRFEDTTARIGLFCESEGKKIKKMYPAGHGIFRYLCKKPAIPNRDISMRTACFFFFLSACLSANVLTAQNYITRKTASKKQLKLYEQAREYAVGKEFVKALEVLSKLTEVSPPFVDAWLLMGDVYYDGLHLAKAEETYEHVLRFAPAYRAIAWYKLALCEWRQRKEREAIEHMEMYLATGKGSEEQRKRVARELEQLRFSLEARQHPVPFSPEKMGPEVNTERAEYSPVLTADGEQLLFVRVTEQGGEDFYLSRKVKDEWQEAEPIAELNTRLNEGAPAFSADGKQIIFTICNSRKGLGSCDLYFSRRTSTGGWTAPQNLGPPVNTAAWESLPSLSADGKRLFFSSSREGGQGGKDLWVSRRLRNGKWSKPKNLGDVINTAGDEMAPFIHADGKTLYFMSSGHPGMGGFDLFMSRQREDGSWSEPLNLGYPINDMSSEGALYVAPNGYRAFYASDRDGPLEGISAFVIQQNSKPTDIYAFDLPEAVRAQACTYAKIRIYDRMTNDPLRALVGLRDLKDGGRFIWRQQASEDGELLCLLPLGTDYALEIAQSGYLFYSDHFALAEERSVEEPYLLSVGLIPVPRDEELARALDQAVVLRNVFFDSGSAELRPESQYELNRLARLLKENYQLKIEIRGHTDEVGREEDNLELSRQRAEAVRRYLIEKGIAEDRLTARGFGESRPIADNDSPEGRQKNRRTEFVVTGVAF